MEMDQLEHIAVLVGEPARIKILWALMDGKAHTATELSMIADISPQSASMHLGKLTDAHLLKVYSQGRHRYYSYARDEVAYAIEALAGLIMPDKKSTAKKTKDHAFSYCRSCYDHLAGTTGVAIADSLLKFGYLVENHQVYEITPAGHLFFKDLGIDTHTLSKQKRSLAKPCLDWSERRPHLAGALGAALLEKMIANQWMRRVQHSRTLAITAIGKINLYDRLGLEI